jgi:hypothetical protein
VPQRSLRWRGTLHSTLCLLRRFRVAASLHHPLALKTGSGVSAQCDSTKAHNNTTNKPAIHIAYIHDCNKGRQLRQDLPQPTVWHKTVAVFYSQQSLCSSPNSPQSMEPECSLPCSQQPATCQNPEPCSSNSRLPTMSARCT